MTNFKKIFNFMGKYKTFYVLSIIALILSQLFVTLSPIVVQTTIDSIIGNKPIPDNFMRTIIGLFGGRDLVQSKLWLIGLLIICIVGLRGLFTFLRSYLSSLAAENAVKNIRDQMYDHIQRLPYDYHVKVTTGDLLQKATSDVETLRRVIAIQFMEFISSSFLIIFVLRTMFTLNTKMALASLPILPLIFIFAFTFFRKVKKDFSRLEEDDSLLSTTLQENLTGVRVVKAFSRQQYEIEKFDVANKNFASSSYKLNLNLANYFGLSDLICLSQVLIIVVYGIYLSYLGELTLGVFTAFLTYINMLVWPIRQMGRNLTDMGKAVISFERIQEILDLPIENFSESGKCPEINGEISFDNVSFSYTENLPVLKNISFSIAAGKTLGIIGATGSGKSTLVNLLPRLYDYDTGSIKIDGMELKSLDKSWIRKNIGFVLQEPFLYAKTIGENIKLTEPDIDDNSMYKATNIASIHKDIMSFDSKYNTLVGERGTSLSGGQQQRVAISRTIIKEKPIVIFDDSLSAVDSETDTDIRKALMENKSQSTNIIISHRISTIEQADLILVLEDGKIVEQGSHIDLINKNGLYKKVYSIQNSIDIDTKEELYGR